MDTSNMTSIQLSVEDRKKFLETLSDLAEPIEILAPHEFLFEMAVWIVTAPFLLIRRVYETVAV